MTWLRLALSNLLLSPLTSAVNVLLMTLGTASIVLLILAGDRLSNTLTRDARGVDLVVGAEGSPAQLILSSVYHADIPPGNIPLADAQTWAEDPRVALAAPLSLGDSFRGFRIVGTTSSYLTLFDASIEQGVIWQEPLQAVIGSAVARASGLTLGSQFTGAHGFSEDGHEHDSQPYEVVGILAPVGSVVDRLILTSLESVWMLHGQEVHGDSHAHGVEEDHAHEHDDHEGDAHHEDDHHGDAHDEDAHHDDGHHDDEHHEDEHDEDAHHDDGHHEEEHHEDAHHDDGHHDDEHHEGEHHEDAQHDDGHHEDEHREDEHHGDDEEHEHGSGGEHDHAHGAEDLEITAMLLRYRTPLAAMSLPRQINADSSLQAAAPAMEIARILQLVGLGLEGLRAFAWVLIVTACLSVFAALYGSLRTRRGDLAMLRCLGATRAEVFLAMLSEGLVLSLAGIALGYSFGHGAISIVSGWLETHRGVSLAGVHWTPAETQLLGVLLAVSVLSAAIPAFQAYRTDVARTLAQGGE